MDLTRVLIISGSGDWQQIWSDEACLVTSHLGGKYDGWPYSTGSADKAKKTPKGAFFIGGERGIRTLDGVLSPILP